MKTQELEKELKKTKMRGIWMTIWFICGIGSIIGCMYFTNKYGESSPIPYITIIIIFFSGWRIFRLWKINQQKTGSVLKNIQK